MLGQEPVQSPWGGEGAVRGGASGWWDINDCLPDVGRAPISGHRSRPGEEWMSSSRDVRTAAGRRLARYFYGCPQCPAMFTDTRKSTHLCPCLEAMIGLSKMTDLSGFGAQLSHIYFYEQPVAEYGQRNNHSTYRPCMASATM